MATETQALTRIEPPGALIQQVGGKGLEDIYIKPTNIFLGQRTSRNPAIVPGKLFDDLTDTNFDTLQVVPLAIRRSRALFPEGGALGATPICRSDDGKVPSKFAEYPQASHCKDCPKGSWENYNKKNGTGKPSCKENWQLLMILKEMGLPRRFYIGGKGLTPFKKLLERIKQDITIEQYKNKDTFLNLFDYTFTIESEAVQGEKGSYFVPKFTNVKRILTPGEFGPMYELYVESQQARKDEETVGVTVDEAVGEIIDGEVIEV